MMLPEWLPVGMVPILLAWWAGVSIAEVSGKSEA